MKADLKQRFSFRIHHPTPTPLRLRIKVAKKTLLAMRNRSAVKFLSLIIQFSIYKEVMKVKKTCQNAISVKVQKSTKKAKSVKNAMEQAKLHLLFSKMSNHSLMKKLKHFVLHRLKRFSKTILNPRLE